MSGIRVMSCGNTIRIPISTMAMRTKGAMFLMMPSTLAWEELAAT